MFCGSTSQNSDTQIKIDLTSMKMKISCCGLTKQQQQPKQQRKQNNKNSFNFCRKK